MQHYSQHQQDPLVPISSLSHTSLAGASLTYVRVSSFWARDIALHHWHWLFSPLQGSSHYEIIRL